LCPAFAACCTEAGGSSCHAVAGSWLYPRRSSSISLMRQSALVPCHCSLVYNCSNCCAARPHAARLRLGFAGRCSACQPGCSPTPVVCLGAAGFKVVVGLGAILGMGYGFMTAAQAPLEKRLDQQREDIKVRTRLACSLLAVRGKGHVPACLSSRGACGVAGSVHCGGGPQECLALPEQHRPQPCTRGAAHDLLVTGLHCFCSPPCRTWAAS
jgi:hypothetical protein